MHPFEYIRATHVRQAVATAAAGPAAAFLAGGTTQVDLMKDGVFAPQVLIDITRLPLRGVTAGGGVLRVGALTTMEELAACRWSGSPFSWPPRRSCGTWPRSAGTCCSGPAAATTGT